MALKDFITGKTNRIVVGGTAGIGLIIAAGVALLGTPADVVKNNAGVVVHQRTFDGNAFHSGALTVGNLAVKSALNCDSVDTTSTGQIICGVDGGSGGGGDWSNTGSLQTAFDSRFVNVSGDTMTGALTVNVTGGTKNTLGLVVLNTISGAVIRAQSALAATGTLAVDGTATFNGILRALGSVTQATQGFDRVDIGVEAGTPRMVFEDATATTWLVDNNAGTFRWFIPNNQQMNLTTSAASPTLQLLSAGVVNVSLSTNGVSYLQGGNVAIGRSTAKATLDVVGTASGTNLYAASSMTGQHLYAANTIAGAGLTDCDGDGQTVAWDATTKTFGCGDDDSGGGSGSPEVGTASFSGAVRIVGDTRYVKKQGDTMTGALTINLTSGHMGLKLLQTMSGNIIHAEKTLTSSGTIVAKPSAGSGVLALRVLGTQTLTGTAVFQSRAAGIKPLIGKGAVGQTAALIESQDSSGNALARFGPRVSQGDAELFTVNPDKLLIQDEIMKVFAYQGSSVVFETSHDAGTPTGTLTSPIFRFKGAVYETSRAWGEFQFYPSANIGGHLALQIGNDFGGGTQGGISFLRYDNRPLHLIIGSNTTVPLGQLEVEASWAGNRAAVFRGQAGQTANLTEWRNGASLAQALITPSGSGTFAGLLINGSTYEAGLKLEVVGTMSGSNLFVDNVAISTGSTIPVYVATSRSNTISNTITETNFNRTFPLPANSLKVGDVLRFTLSGTGGSAAATNAVIRIKAGSTTLIASPDWGPGDTDDESWSVTAHMTVRSIGASGTMYMTAEYSDGTSSGNSCNIWCGVIRSANPSFDTTSAQTLQVSAQWAGAATTNIITLEQFFIEKLTPIR